MKRFHFSMSFWRSSVPAPAPQDAKDASKKDEKKRRRSRSVDSAELRTDLALETVSCAQNVSVESVVLVSTSWLPKKRSVSSAEDTLTKLALQAEFKVLNTAQMCQLEDGRDGHTDSPPPVLRKTPVTSSKTVTFACDSEDLGLNRKSGQLLHIKKIVFGTNGTLQQRIFFRKDSWHDVSPWHDIPLFGPDGLLQFVCTTPQGQWVRYEVAENEECNPLRVKKQGNWPCHYAENVPWNYGFLPQTIFSSASQSMDLRARELESLPIYVFDLSSIRARETGDVYPVKPLVAFLVFDRGNMMSWHILAIDREDYRGNFIDSPEDLECYFPDAIDKASHWLQNRHCLSPGDKGSRIAHGGIPVRFEALMRVVKHSHASWKVLSKVYQEKRGCTPSTGPLAAIDLQHLWATHTAHESRVQIQLSKPCQQASLTYEKAWVEVLGGEGLSRKPEAATEETVEREGEHKKKSDGLFRGLWAYRKGSISGQNGTCNTAQQEFSLSRRLKKCITESITTLKYK